MATAGSPSRRTEISLLERCKRSPRLLLRSLDLRRFFAAVVGPDLDSENECKATTLKRAMRELSFDARPVMVGDRKYDVAAAHEHQIRAIGVLWGIGSERELTEAGADYLARTPADLATLLIP